jgi:hypothetical protein
VAEVEALLAAGLSPVAIAEPARHRPSLVLSIVEHGIDLLRNILQVRPTLDIS